MATFTSRAPLRAIDPGPSNHSVPATASTPDGRKDVPELSELSDLEDDAEKAKKKKAAIKRGKRKAVVVNSDEEQEPQAHRRVTRRKK